MNCQLLYTNLILSSHYQTAANNGFFAMLSSEHILIDISLISCSLPAGRQVTAERPPERTEVEC